MNTAILGALRVVEFATGLAPAAAAMQLGEVGAQVTKVFNDLACETTLFRVLDRGKTRVRLAADPGLALEQLHGLLAGADVLIHDFTPAQTLAWSLNDELLSQRYPALVVCGIAGWPRNHALANAPVRETLVLARLGLLDEQPGHRQGPVFVRMPYASWMAAWLAVIGVMARLLARTRDGHGGVAHTSLAQGALIPMTMHWSRAEHPSAVFAKGLDKHIPIPLHQCADGRWLHVHYSPDAAPWMADALARLGPGEVARLNALWPPSHVAPNFGANRAIIATRPAQAWVEHFWQHDVAAQIAAPLGSSYFDEQAHINSYVIRIDDPRLGPTLQPGPVVHVTPAAQAGAGLQPFRTPVAASATNLAPTAGDAAPLPPLHGIKVLDLGAYLAGPVACMLLADLGAEVIKLEAPSGDAMRRLERVFTGTQRGKLGLALKLGDPQARPVLEALVREADVVHHNMRLPAARKLQVDYATLARLKPDLVYCHVSAYGPQGPRADWPGFDQLMQAACGWEVEQGGVGNPPQWLRFGVGDFFAGLSSLYAVLLALYHRHQTGQGQSVSTSLLGATQLTLAETVAMADGTLTAVDHLDAGQCGLSDHHRLYACREGWVAVAAVAEDEIRAFHALVGEAPTHWFAAHAQGQALELLLATGVPAEGVRLDQQLAFEHNTEHAAAGLHAHYQHARYGALQQLGAFWDFGDLPLALHRAPPELGQHSREILQRLGLEAQHIQRLASLGVVAL
jgi:crotonobetainyl-CoA:carnitine CoA-transferase CaiB-like acyl-CoA transferase